MDRMQIVMREKLKFISPKAYLTSPCYNAKFWFFLSLGLGPLLGLALSWDYLVARELLPVLLYVLLGPILLIFVHAMTLAGYYILYVGFYVAVLLWTHAFKTKHQN